MAISKKFCMMMGGDIDVRSAPKKGTTFVIRIPARPDSGAGHRTEFIKQRRVKT